jgi:hypothetical protein
MISPRRTQRRRKSEGKSQETEAEVMGLQLQIHQHNPMQPYLQEAARSTRPRHSRTQQNRYYLPRRSEMKESSTKSRSFWEREGGGWVWNRTAPASRVRVAAAAAPLRGDEEASRCGWALSLSLSLSCPGPSAAFRTVKRRKRTSGASRDFQIRPLHESTSTTMMAGREGKGTLAEEPSGESPIYLPGRTGTRRGRGGIGFGFLCLGGAGKRTCRVQTGPSWQGAPSQQQQPL